MRMLLPQTLVLFVVLLTAPLCAEDKTEPKAPEKPVVSEERLQEIFSGAAPKTVEELRAMEARQKQLAEKVSAYTVGLQVGPAHGSGVVISKDGYILTAAHVAMAPKAPVRIIFPDGKIATGRSLGTNKNNDAGMVKIDETKDDEGNVVEWTHAEMGLASSLKRGQWVFSAGHPGGFQKNRNVVVRVGRLLGINKDVLISDCPLIGGDSGGPLFDMQGNVIGIHSRIGQSLSANFHVPVNAYADDWDRLAKAEAWGNRLGGDAKPSIGVTVNTSDERATIRGVREGGPAQQAGIQSGDVIVEFDGEVVLDASDLISIVGKHRIGERVKVKIERDDETLTLDMRVGRTR